MPYGSSMVTTPWCLVGKAGMSYRDYCRDYIGESCRDPSRQSLLRSSEATHLYTTHLNMALHKERFCASSHAGTCQNQSLNLFPARVPSRKALNQSRPTPRNAPEFGASWPLFDGIWSISRGCWEGMTLDP